MHIEMCIANTLTKKRVDEQMALNYGDIGMVTKSGHNSTNIQQ